LPKEIKMKTVKILNLTQHKATEKQRDQGVVELPEAEKMKLQKLLTFLELPTKGEVYERAVKIAAFTTGYEAAMIGGAPFLMSPLETILKNKGIIPLYAFSKRESIERKLPNGSVEKTSVFKFCWFRNRYNTAKGGLRWQ